jgi:hypothetical protein
VTINPTNKPLSIEMGNKKLTLIFDLNTFSAFEDITGKFFVDFLVDMQESVAKVQASALKRAAAKAEGLSAPPLSKEDAIRISAKDFQAFIWAANHTYNEKDESVWPLTMSQIGKLININTIPSLLPALLKSSTQNMPDAADKPKVNGDAAAVEAAHPTQASETEPASGGTESGSLEEEALNSLTPKLAN